MIARRRRDWRTPLLALGVLLFIAALLWGTDALSRVGAQSLIARAVQQDVGSPNRPSVQVHGSFFLPQVVRGRYDDVDIEISPLVSGSLRIADLRTHLYGVHLRFHDVLVRDISRIVVDSTAERAELHYDDLNHYLDATGTGVHVAPGAHAGELRLTGSVKVLGTTISASADATVHPIENGISLTPTQFDTGLSGLDAASRALLGQRFTILLPLQALPFGQKVDKISVGRGGITVRASGRDVVIG